MSTNAEDVGSSCAPPPAKSSPISAPTADRLQPAPIPRPGPPQPNGLPPAQPQLGAPGAMTQREGVSGPPSRPVPSAPLPPTPNAHIAAHPSDTSTSHNLGFVGRPPGPPPAGPGAQAGAPHPNPPRPVVMNTTAPTKLDEAGTTAHADSPQGTARPELRPPTLRAAAPTQNPPGNHPSTGVAPPLARLGRSATVSVGNGPVGVRAQPKLPSSAPPAAPLPATPPPSVPGKLAAPTLRGGPSAAPPSAPQSDALPSDTSPPSQAQPLSIRPAKRAAVSMPAPGTGRPSPTAEPAPSDAASFNVAPSAPVRSISSTQVLSSPSQPTPPQVSVQPAAPPPTTQPPTSESAAETGSPSELRTKSPSPSPSSPGISRLSGSASPPPNRELNVKRLSSGRASIAGPVRSNSASRLVITSSKLSAVLSDENLAAELSLDPSALPPPLESAALPTPIAVELPPPIAAPQPMPAIPPPILSPHPVASAPPPPPIVTSPATPRTTTSSSSAEDSLEKRRNRIVQELYDTETSYVASLQLLQDFFLRPLKTAFADIKKVPADKLEKEKVMAITPEAFDELSALFITWETILGCHVHFRDALSSCVDSKDFSTIGAVILENVRKSGTQPSELELTNVLYLQTKFIKLYRHFVNNFDKILATLANSSAKNPFFKEFTEGLFVKNDFKGLTLNAYLIMPVQRVPRYVMLIADLLKNTVDSHLDYGNIKTALDLVKAFADFINLNKAQAENKEKQEALRNRITDSDGVDLETLIKGRRVIKAGELHLKDIVRKGKKEGESYDAFAFLTDDQLILAKIQKRGDQPKSKLRHVLKTHGSIVLEEKEMTFSTATGDKFIFKVGQDAPPGDLADWKSLLEAACKEAIVRLMKNEDHLFEIVENTEETTVGEEDKKKKQFLARQKVASEILEKELDFANKLGRFADWISRLRQSNNRDLISSEELVNCFANIDAIGNAHREIAALLKPKFDQWTNESTIGDVYRDKLETFRLYRPYIMAYPGLAPSFAQQHAKKPLFLMMLSEFEKENKSETGPTEKLFELPVRRVESLNALLKELLRNTPKDHPDFPHLVWVTKTLNEREEEIKKTPNSSPLPDGGRGRAVSMSATLTSKDKKKK